MDIQEENRACVRLYQAVITQAFDDAVQVLPDIPPIPKKVKRRKRETEDAFNARKREVAQQQSKRRTAQEAHRDTETARKWLLGYSKDFREVVNLALMDPEYIRDKAVWLEAQGWANLRRAA